MANHCKLGVGRWAMGDGRSGDMSLATARLLQGRGAVFDLLHADIVGLLDVRVLPVDDGLRAQPLHVFLVLVLALAGEDAVADLILRLVEGRRLRLAARFELENLVCLLYTSPSPRDRQKSRMPSSA